MPCEERLGTPGCLSWRGVGRRAASVLLQLPEQDITLMHAGNRRRVLPFHMAPEQTECEDHVHKNISLVARPFGLLHS